jgi:hypothetical protein
MKLQQQLAEAIRGQVIEMIAIGGLVLFGVIMVFFGWLKYRDRNKPTRTKPVAPRPKRRTRRK